MGISLQVGGVSHGHSHGGGGHTDDHNNENNDRHNDVEHQTGKTNINVRVSEI